MFLFFSNDFGLTDVQKTAIVMAVGVDREEDTFIVTSQIAIPQSSKQGQSSQAGQLVSRGKTMGEAEAEFDGQGYGIYVGENMYSPECRAVVIA